MIFGKTKTELKVGVFVFIGIVIVISFVLLIGKFKTWGRGRRVNFTFSFVNGVKLGAPVRFAGVDVGEVKAIRLKFVTEEAKVKAYLECWIKDEAKIPLDSSVWVNTLGLLGEKYIEIIPGQDYSRTLPKHGVLAGKDPMPMQEFGELAKRIGEGLDQTIARVNSKEGTVGLLLSDDTLYRELETFATDIRKNPWKLFFKTAEK